MSRVTCDGCALAGRREFLREAGQALAAVAVALGLSPEAARGLVLGVARPLGPATDGLKYPIPPADGVMIDKENQVILVRHEGAVYAFNLSCPHQNTALRWLSEEGRFQCPKHKSRYRPDGTFISGRATRGMDRFAVRREGGAVVVDLDVLYRQDKEPDVWAAAKIGV